YKIIDPIDRIVPSFILFLVFLLIILLLLVFFILPSVFGGTSYFGEIVVLSSKTNLPLSDAKVTITTDCAYEPLVLFTDELGKVSFNVCSDSFDVDVTKSNYKKVSTKIILENNELQTIKLSPEDIELSTKNVKVKIVDNDNDIITNATLYNICDTKTILVGNKQSLTGYDTNFGSCSVTKLRATALDYKEKTVSWDKSSETVTIKLEKDIKKASVTFITENINAPTKIEPEVQITITDSKGKYVSLTTDLLGTGIIDLEVEEYTYSAYSNGENKEGRFVVENTSPMEVKITFKENHNPIQKAIRVQVLTETNSPITIASINVFKDGNIFSLNQRVDSNGVLSLQVNEQYATQNFFIIISAMGYEKKIVKVKPVDSNTPPTKIFLKQGENKLVVKVIDDINAPVKDAFVKVINEEVNLEMDLTGSKITDRNGVYTLTNLPKGNYKVIATSKNSSGETRARMDVNKTTEIEIELVLGEGMIRFNFLNESGAKINPYFYAHTVNKDLTLNNIYNGYPRNGVYDTSKMLVGTKTKLTINDTNYYPTETLTYTITRNTQIKPVILRTIGNLPNNNELQLILENVYETNPLYGSTNSTDKILPNKKYYLLFSLILDTNYTGTPIAGFFSGEKNVPLKSNSTTIESITSIDGFFSLLDTNMNGFFVDPTSTSIVDSGAKIGSINLGQKTGKFSLPILLEIKTDKNTTKDKITYYATMGDKNTIVYEFGFDVGEKFCVGLSERCPTFLFSNFIEKNNTTIPYEDNMILLSEEEYKIKTKIKNTTDTLFSSVELVQSIPKNNQDVFVFSPDKNTAKFNLTINPLSETQFKEVLVKGELTRSVNSTNITINQSIEKIVENVNQLKNYNNDSKQKMRFSLKKKEQLEISISPNTIHEKSEYPLFVVKTKFKGKSGGVSAFWKAEKITETDTETDTTIIVEGKTDTNGIDKTSFNALNLLKGDKILFTAYDHNGSIDGNIIVTISSGFPVPEILVEECLSVEINSTKIKNNSDYYFELPKGNTKTITINSTCDTPREVMIKTDLSLSELSFQVPANENKTFTITGNVRDEIYGAYPVQVISINGTRYSQIGYFDVVVSDPDSEFVLNKAIFDFRESSTLSSSVTNNSMKGRKDNFYPKMFLSTKSTSIEYNKPGNPDQLSFQIKVIGHAIEAWSSCFMWSNKFYQYKDGETSCRADRIRFPTPTEPLYYDVLQKDCERVVESLSKAQKEVTEKPEPEWNENDYVTHITGSNTYTVSQIVSEDGRVTDLNKSNTTTTPTKSSYEVSNTTASTAKAINSNKKNNNAYFDAGTAVATTLNATAVGAVGIIGVYRFFTWDGSAAAYVESFEDTIKKPVENQEFEFYPNTIGPIDIEPRCFEVKYNMPWVSAPRPSGWTDCAYGECWSAIHEIPKGLGKVIAVNNDKETRITAMGLGEMDIPLILYTQGHTRNWVDSLTHSDNYPSWIDIQTEFLRSLHYYKEQKKVWTKDVNMGTREGIIYDLGTYNAIPTPMWVDEKTTLDAGDSEKREGTFSYNAFGKEGSADGTTLVTSGESTGIGFIPPEKAPGYEVESPESPLIEYDPSGMYKFVLNTEGLPRGVKAYLRDGKVYAVYYGVPEIPGNNIDFNLTKIDLIGKEYAILKVQDWVNGTTKKEKAFQIKLIGPESLCVNSRGEDGYTGAAYVPRLLFKWDWTNISEDQCDTTNNNYTYCDGVQFNISLFKKLAKFQNDYIIKQRMDLLAQKTTFYSYLIRDNFSTDLLNDFSHYYTNTMMASDLSFYTNPGYNVLIKQGKIIYKIRNPDGSYTNDTKIPYGGLYRVEISIELINPNISSIFDGENANANIIVTLMPIEKAKNYNAFYETPFDGEVGKKGNTYARNNYGTSFNIENIVIQDSPKLTSKTFTGNPMVSLNATLNNNVTDLQSGIVLKYNSNNKTLIFTPSTPNPVSMQIDNPTKGTTLNVEYTIDSTISDPANMANKLVNKWLLVSSNIKDGEDKCLDFEKKGKRIITETASGNNKKISWTNAEKGKITLSTIIFAPPTTSIKLIPTNKTLITLNGKETNNNEVFIKGQTETANLAYLFEQIKQKNMCISKGNETETSIWWSEEYLNDLRKSVSNTSSSCK
ncbi:MAG: carboxypeptidase regulatory-like domain-containing protein, partial [Candidatus Diapherotrites archaeon]|nr:carboxypeptidase regulatory-like domain-containing protein [Candidatus Diapherotrites archaeon]